LDTGFNKAQFRKMLHKRGVAYPGVFASSKAGGIAVFESLLERDFQTLLGADPRVKRYASHSHLLNYPMPNRTGSHTVHQYTPDAVVEFQNGQILIVEVKAEFLTKEKYWTTREPHIRETYAQEHGLDFVVVTERKIRVQPRLSNAQRMLRYGAWFDDPEAIFAVRDVLISAIPGVAIRDVCEAVGLCRSPVARTYSALLRLALDGVVALDLERKLSLDTKIMKVLA
jgi:hypothetical protein